MKIEVHNGIHVLRDDLLPGGTKSILMPSMIGEDDEYVYASPVYGGFQIALSAYCKSIGKQATIFCARRKSLHPNTLKCIELGAKVMEVKGGYLVVVEKYAKDYCALTGAKKLVFGANTKANKGLIADRCRQAMAAMGGEPDEIWCAIGSGTLVKSILAATTTAQVHGVQVGQAFTEHHPRLTVHIYPQDFASVSKHRAPFPSMPNYDLKAWEYCEKLSRGGSTLFWNVL
jgi:hypothetical protein